MNSVAAIPEHWLDPYDFDPSPDPESGPFRLAFSRVEDFYGKHDGGVIKIERNVAWPAPHRLTGTLVSWSLQYLEGDDRKLKLEMIRLNFRPLFQPGAKAVVRAWLKDKNNDDKYEFYARYRFDYWQRVEGPMLLHLIQAAGGERLQGTNRSIDVPLSWDTVVVNDYIYRPSGTEIRVDRQGLHSISVQCSIRAIDASGGPRSASGIAIQVDDGTGFVDLPGGISQGYVREPGETNLSTSLSCETMAAIGAGHKLRFVLFNASDRLITAEVVPGSLRLTVRFLR